MDKVPKVNNSAYKKTNPGISNVPLYASGYLEYEENRLKGRQAETVLTIRLND